MTANGTGRVTTARLSRNPRPPRADGPAQHVEYRVCTGTSASGRPRHTVCHADVPLLFTDRLPHAGKGKANGATATQTK